MSNNKSESESPFEIPLNTSVNQNLLSNSKSPTRCLGTTQHLKTKYGRGFDIVMKFLTFSRAVDIDPLIASWGLDASNADQLAVR